MGLYVGRCSLPLIDLSVIIPLCLEHYVPLQVSHRPLANLQMVFFFFWTRLLSRSNQLQLRVKGRSFAKEKAGLLRITPPRGLRTGAHFFNICHACAGVRVCPKNIPLSLQPGLLPWISFSNLSKMQIWSYHFLWKIHQWFSMAFRIKSKFLSSEIQLLPPLSASILTTPHALREFLTVLHICHALSLFLGFFHVAPSA